MANNKPNYVYNIQGVAYSSVHSDSIKLLQKSSILQRNVVIAFP